MNDIIFLKFCCSKTNREKGLFRVMETSENTFLVYFGIYGEYNISDRINTKSLDHLLYPLLLTRTIEGINETDPWKIDIYYEDNKGWSWSYKDYHKEGEYYNFADDAKKAVIAYVMKVDR